MLEVRGYEKNAPQTLMEKLEVAERALAAAADDFQRIDVRDYAKAVAAGAAIFRHKDIQVRASNLIMDAERAIAKANPPMSRSESASKAGKSGGRGRNSVVILNNTAIETQPAIRSETLRQIRQAHHRLTDAEYEKAKQESIENQEPLTRSALKEIRKKGDLSANKFLRHANGVYEWYTPEAFIISVRRVLGQIDLDPASSEKANRIVKATKFYTQSDNGLNKAWRGKIFMNPPFKNKLIKQFVSKLLKHIKSCEVTEAILLTDSCTDTGWFQDALSLAAAYCFPKGRLKFYGPHDEIQFAQRPQTFFYFGDNVEMFKAVFETKGFVVIV